jgi:16S rRNA (cytidine1402-2'-O)-methyltransferase
VASGHHPTTIANSPRSVSSPLRARSTSAPSEPRTISSWSFVSSRPIAADERGCVVYEAPGRVTATLTDLAAACGRERPGAIARELTKVHEEFVRAPLGELADRARSGELTLRGEFAIVVGSWPGGTPAAASPDDDAAALAEVERRVAAGSARGEAVRTVAAETGIPRRRLYRVTSSGR